MLTGERNRGFTLVEVLIAVVLVVIIFGVAAGTIIAGQDSLGGSSLQGEMQDRAQLALTRIAAELMATGPSCPDWEPNPAAATVMVEYRLCKGYNPVTAEVEWDPPEGIAPRQIVLVDNDDGPYQVIRIRDESKGQDEPIQADVTAFTIQVDPDNTGNDRRVLITLQISKDDVRVSEGGGPGKDVIRRTLGVFLRN